MKVDFIGTNKIEGGRKMKTNLIEFEEGDLFVKELETEEEKNQAFKLRYHIFFQPPLAPN